MTSNPGYMRAQGDILEKKVKGLLNSDLKSILKDEGLPVSGNKASLQERILQHVRNIVTGEDYPRFREIHKVINRYGTSHNLELPIDPNSSSSYNSYASPASIHRPQYLMPNRAHNPRPGGYGYSTNAQHPPSFKRSPFYELKEPLTSPIPVPAMNSSRNTVTAPVTLSHEQSARLTGDTSLRIMAYCGLEQDLSPKDISFPAQVDLRCNQEQYSGNLRGMKKKSGTTKPADITAFIQKRAGFKNVVSLSHAGNDKRFQLVVYLVRKVSVESLVDRIRHGQIITKQSVLNDMISKAKDPDIVATSTITSLKCPLSATRMQLPCRSTICNHNQCYDAASFLQLQEQAPQWSCPVCNKIFNFEALVVDQYVQDIISNTSSSVDQVTIEPDGNWRPGVHTNSEFRTPSARPTDSTAMKRKASDVFDVDGGVEILETHSNGPKHDASRNTSTPQASYPTPNFTSREPSTAPSASSRSASKRPAEPVIDLTLSSDDDDDDVDPPRRPIKRQSTGGGISSTPQLHSPSVDHYQAPRSAPANPRSLPNWMPDNWTPAQQQSAGVSIPIGRGPQQQQQFRRSPQYGANWFYRGTPSS